MPEPVTAAVVVAKRYLWRRVAKVAAIVAPTLLCGAMTVWLLAAVVAGSLATSDQSASTGGTCSSVIGGGGASAAGLTQEQLGNAGVIVAVGRELNVPPYGWVIGLAAGLQESGLRNLDHGDRDSLGLFQQRSSWGTAAQRMDPPTSAAMFFEGSNGAPGLLQVDGFMSMTVTDAAQAVQRSAFPNAYARWEPLASLLVTLPQVLSATCVDNVDYRGDGTVGARAVSAAMRYIGTPYSWGGGGPTGPSLGFGPGAHTVGFDCSGLVQYAWHQAAGLLLPRVADQQASTFPVVPAGQPLRPGDLMFFRSPFDPPGLYHHVGIADGQGNMVHAPRTGRTVEVVHDVLKDPYYASQFAFAVRPAANSIG